MDQEPTPRRAQRFHVSWPARVRRDDDSEWHPCRTVNLSVSGVLLRTDREFEVGERVEVEIEFLATVQSKSIIVGTGRVVRHDPSIPGGAAIFFLSEPSGISETSMAPN